MAAKADTSRGLAVEPSIETSVNEAQQVPEDVWILIATQILHVSGRNGVIHLTSVNKSLFSLLTNSVALWKEIAHSYYFRLLEQADKNLYESFSVQQWRRLLRNLVSCGCLKAPIKVDGNIAAKGPFGWVPAWMKDDLNEGWIGEDMEPREGLFGAATLKPAVWTSLRHVLQTGSEEELLLYRGDPIYAFGRDINTADFWFSHRKSEDGTDLNVRIGDLLNSDAAGQFSALSDNKSSASLLDDKELLQSFAELVPFEISSNLLIKPVENVVAALVPIVPECISSRSSTEPVECMIPPDWREEHARNIECYRYKMPTGSLPFVEHCANDVIHVLLPLQDSVLGYNEERVKYYEEQMRNGALPTVAAVTRVFGKYRVAEKGNHLVRTQQVIVSIILDGHHKIEASIRTNCPVGLLMFADAKHQTIFEAINHPVPTWPLNQYPLRQFFSILFRSSKRFGATLTLDFCCAFQT